MLPRNDWGFLHYWDSGEWQKIEEDLDDYDHRGIQYCPRRDDLFRALCITSFADTKVAIFGQDPYPTPEDATGVAFSIPKDRKVYPPTLQNIFREYSDIHGDLKYPYPKSGDLESWCRQGVLLWNVYPICLAYQPASCHWTEWDYLTREIVEMLHAKGTLLVSLGNVANKFIVDRDFTLHYSHPSPLGYKKSNSPFFGSRIFSTINDRLCSRSMEPIDWRLPDGTVQKEVVEETKDKPRVLYVHSETV